MRDERFGGVVRVREEMAAAVALALLERLEDQSFLPGPHATQRANASIGRRVFEIGEGPDAQLAVQRRDGLWPDAVQVEQVEDGRGKLGQQLAMNGGAARGGDLADSRGQILPDARNLPQRRFVERGEMMGMIGGDVGAVPIRANLERIVVLELQEVRNLLENARHAQVIQAAARSSRSDSREPARRRRPARRRWPPGPRVVRSRRDTRRRPRRRPSPRWRPLRTRAP